MFDYPFDYMNNLVDCFAEPALRKANVLAVTRQQKACHKLQETHSLKTLIITLRSPLPKYIFDSDLISQTADFILVKNSDSIGFLSGMSEVRTAT